MTEQLSIGEATLTNEQGARRGVAQLDEIDPKRWYVYYNRRQDTLYFRAVGHGPATSYHLPDEPEVFLRLDGNLHLVGIDLTDFRRVLVKRHPEMRYAVRALHVAQLMRRVRWLRAVAETLDRGIQARARDDIQRVTARLCPG